MDKLKGLQILGLGPSATRMDARIAFRRLAKIFHPDRFAQDLPKAKVAEEKMKQLNEAFHFLLPLLPDTDAWKGGGKSPSDVNQGDGPPQCRIKRSGNFFSSLVAGLGKFRDAGKRAKVRGTGCTGQTDGMQRRAGNAGRTKQTEFETVFRHTVNLHQAGGKPRTQPVTGPQSRYANYGTYFNATRVAPGHMSRMNKRGVGPVQEISPIAPVSPVKR